MSVTVVESTFDVALWFQDRARREDTYLQAQMLQPFCISRRVIIRQ